VTEKVRAAVAKAVGPNSDELLSVEEVAAFYKVPVRTIYSWQATNRGPRAYRVGRYLRFKRSDCIAFLESQAS
jgi:excisionase family DNA binding protein